VCWWFDVYEVYEWCLLIEFCFTLVLVVVVVE